MSEKRQQGVQFMFPNGFRQSRRIGHAFLACLKTFEQLNALKGHGFSRAACPHVNSVGFSPWDVLDCNRSLSG
jgi:hypothetical protein